MPNLEEQRQKAYEVALQKSYLGCLFDLDGTLTVRGEHTIPAGLQEIFREKASEIPLAICTGRNFEFASSLILPIFTEAPDSLQCQENCVFICENGSVGYFYDRKSQKYREFYNLSFPYPEATRIALYERLLYVLQDKVGTHDLNNYTLVFRAKSDDGVSKEVIAERSHEMAKIISAELTISDPDQLLTFGDSGIGVIVFRRDGNKDRGVREFAKFLQEQRGIDLSDLKELVVVGDQPGPGGNDEAFLAGVYGTPFTVGETHPEHLLPLPVYEKFDQQMTEAAAKILQGPEGTEALLRQLHFRTDVYC